VVLNAAEAMPTVGQHFFVRTMTMIQRLLVATALLAVSVSGCGEQTSDSGDLSRHRKLFNSAMESTDTEYRDMLMISVASTAAEDGDGAVAKDAVAAITDADERDVAAAEAAYALARSGDQSAASEVAKLITNASDRDAVLGDIADSQ
jgi:hypothetical protein